MKQTRLDGTTILLFICAVALSTAAAFYAVSGLMAIFAAAVVPIIVMGSTLEFSKLVLASWLYRNWKYTSSLLKAYFVVALIILMGLTSMGIFGYLSKAHLDQAVPTGDVVEKVKMIDEKIAIQQEIIAQYRSDMDILNDQINKYNELGAVTKGVAAREAQKEERNAIITKIEQTQAEVTRLRTERATVNAELRKVEAEVGPLKYVAALLYGDSLDQNLLEKAVRLVIIMIVVVFDPLAVLMLIAVNQSSMRIQNGESKPEEENFEQKTVTITVSDQEPRFEGTVTFKDEEATVSVTNTEPEPERRAEVTITPTQSWEPEVRSEPAPAEPVPDLQPEPMPVQSGSTDDTTRAEVPVAEVPEPVLKDSDLLETVGRSTSGRPERYK